MKLISFTLIVFFITTFAKATGNGAGGGGSHLETKFINSAWEAINAITQEQLHDPKISNLVDDIKKMLNETDPKKKLKIEPVDQLKACNNNTPVLIDYDAWGCVRRIQITPNFNFLNLALVFHELTRATPGHLNDDEAMRISIGILKLNTGDSVTNVVIRDDYFPKSQYSRNDVLGVEKNLLDFGVEVILATRITETDEYYILKAIWSRVGDDFDSTIIKSLRK